MAEDPPKRGKTRTILLLLFVTLLAIAGKRIQDTGGVPAFTTSIIPYVPSHHLQTLAVYMMHLVTSWVFPGIRQIGFLPADQCRLPEHEADQLVSIAVSKGGSVVSAFFVWELIMGCGFSAAISGKPNDAWPPGPDVNSPFAADIYIAPGNTVNWPEYAYKSPEKRVRCVVFTRDPFDRFFSLYKYSFDGGESGLREHSKAMHDLATLDKRLDYVWQTFGRESMITTHATLLKSLDRKHGCTQIYMDDLIKGGEYFDKAVTSILSTFKIKQELHAKLLKRLQTHDLTRQSKERLDANEHVSGRSISSADKARIKQLMKDHKEIRELLNKQREDLGYTTY